MSSHDQPLVSVVTPVYNGEAYLAECIESIIAQTYSNWEYLIVDNCSTDGTLAVARHYASLDSRIRVYENTEFLAIIANHNRAFRLISPVSKYCKVLSGDDWLFPECLAQMVDLAEANPTVGIVGTYQLSGTNPTSDNWRVRWTGLPYPSAVVPGHKACRDRLLGGPYVFGTPSSLLYRSDLVRASDAFYPNATAEADTSACFKHLRETDFGFVHQVLAYERVHQQTQSAECRKLNSYISSWLGDLVDYGPDYLTPPELQKRLSIVLAAYYRFLSANVFHFKDRAFWKYHKTRLAECGHPFSAFRLMAAVCANVLDVLLNPKQTVERALRWFLANRPSVPEPSVDPKVEPTLVPVSTGSAENKGRG